MRATSLGAGALLLAVACESPRAGVRGGHANDSAGIALTPATPPAGNARHFVAGDTAGATCAPPAGGVRVSGARVAGLPATTTLYRLRALCAAPMRRDTVDASDGVVALRLAFPGAVVLVRFARDTGDARDAEPRNWRVAGNDVRFADGTPLPRTLGALRALDSLGRVEPSDDESTPKRSTVYLCKHPGLLVEVGEGARTPAHEWPWSLAEIAPGDTARVVALWVVPERTDSAYIAWRGRCGGGATR